MFSNAGHLRRRDVSRTRRERVSTYAGPETERDGSDLVLEVLTIHAASVLGVAGAGVILAEPAGYVCVGSSLEAVARVQRVAREAQTAPCIDAIVGQQPEIV